MKLYTSKEVFDKDGAVMLEYWEKNNNRAENIKNMVLFPI